MPPKHFKKTHILRNLVGKVEAIISPYKAVIHFYLNGNEERALMKKEKYVFHGKLAMNNERTLQAILPIGSFIKFVAHNFEASSLFDRNNFDWFIILGWCEEDMRQLGVRYMPGIVNAPARVIKLRQRRQGVLNYDLKHGGSYNILFYGSKLFMYEKRVNAKRALKGIIHLDDTLCCDAVPCDPNQNNSYCSWFATMVWRGRKPSSKQHLHTGIPQDKNELLTVMRTFTTDARVVFIKAQARVVSVREDFGMALMNLQASEWVSVLFHKSALFMKGRSMASKNLRTMLKKRDTINVLCVSSNGKQHFEYVACQVTLDFHPREEEYDPDHGFNPYYFGR